jgi:hypothetical protein
MIDYSGHSPFGTFKGQAWIFLVSPISASSPPSIRKLADHPGTKGELVGGPGTLSLYRYIESPFGAYDELSYSPGRYEYLNIQKYWPYSTAKRITKSYVSCNDNDVHMIRSSYGIPAEQARFNWNIVGTGEVAVRITLPNGEHIVEFTFKQSSFPSFTVNSTSLISNAVDLAKLVPIVQPLLDGNQVPVPQTLSPHSPLLESAPLLKMYTSIQASSGLATVTRAVTNGRRFPPIGDIGISRYGLVLTEMTMNLNPSEVVLDVVTPRERRTWRICEIISNWIKAVVFTRKTT